MINIWKARLERNRSREIEEERETALEVQCKRIEGGRVFILFRQIEVLKRRNARVDGNIAAI